LFHSVPLLFGKIINRSGVPVFRDFAFYWAKTPIGFATKLAGTRKNPALLFLPDSILPELSYPSKRTFSN
jgi:hypothetical protein